MTNYTITIEYGTAKNRHRGKYTAMNTSRTEAIQQADAYFAKRNRNNRRIANVQEWRTI